MSEAAERLARVQDRIDAAARRASRDPAGITLVAVSKTFPTARIKELLDAGHRDFGENRAQELEAKVRDISEDVSWHFVGHLQSNKAKAVTGVSLIHSIESLKTAEAVSRRAERIEVEQRVLIEVNTSGEDSKSGVAPAQAIDLARDVDRLPAISVAGLMTIPALPLDPEDSRPTYKDMAELAGDLRRALPEAGELSMGMSRDFEVAVEEGATLVRVGEAVFGPRPAKSAP
jgi:PLP dependent protein